MRQEMEKILSEKLAVLQRQLEMTQQAIPPMKEMTNTWASLQKLPENMQALQEGLENLQVSTKEDLQMLRADLEERVSKSWNTPERSESKENLVEVENQAGRTVERITSVAVESMRQEMEKILSEKLAVLQRQLEMTQQAIPPMKEMTNTWASLQKLPENMQALQEGLENLQVSTKEDLQMLRADLEERVSKSWNTPERSESKENLVEVENQAGRTVETNTSWGQESMREEMEKILSEKLAVLQRQLEMTQQAIPPMKEMTNTWASLQKLPETMQALQKGLENLQVSTKEDLQTLRADLEERVPKAWNTPEMPESKENLVEVENQEGRTVEMITSVTVESVREEMEKILSEKLAVLQRQLEMTQQAIPPMKEMTNTWASLQKLPENMQALQKGLENLQVSTKEDLQTLRADLEERVSNSWNTPKRSDSEENLVEVENQAGRTVEMITSVAVESVREEMEKILSEKLAVLQRQLEMTQQAIPPMKEMTNTWASLQKLPENMQALQKGLENLQVSTKEDLQTLRADLEERVSNSWNTPKRSDSEENLVEVENQAGRTVEMITSVAVESVREEMEKILSEKLAVLQRQLEMTQQAIPPMKEMTNTWASLQKLPENMQALQKGLENLQVSTKEDLQTLRADLEERVSNSWNTPKRSDSEENLVEVENQAGRTVEMITSVAVESVREEMEKILSEKLAVLQRQLEMTQQAIPPMKEMTNTWASLQKLPENMQALQKGLENLQVSTKEDLQTLRADLEERVSNSWNTPKRSDSEENLVEVENQAGRTVETNTSWGQESMREEMEKILSEKLAVLQRQLEMTQQAIPPMKEMTNTWASLQKLPENMQALQKGLENLQVSTKEDLQMLRADLEERVPKAWNVPERSESEENLVEVENQAGRTVEMITSVAVESVREEMEKILSEKLAVLQRQLEMTQQAIPPMKEMTNTWASLQKLPENMQALQKGLENLQVSTKEDLQTLRADLEERVSNSWNTPKRSDSEENLVEVENQAGRTVEMITSVAVESVREEMEKILSEKLAVLQRQLEMTQQAIPPMKEMTNTWASLQKLPENMQALQKGLENLQVSTKEDLQTLRADLEERVSNSWNTPKRSDSEENLVEVENQAGRTVETNTSWGQESMREEMEKILSEKLALLQRQLEMTQQAIPPMKEMTNTWASLQKLPENMQALQKGLENLQVSTKEDLQTLRADLEERVPKAWNTPEMPESKENLVEVENQAGRTVEMITSVAMESVREEMEKILSEKLALLQRQLEMTQQAIPPMKEMTNTWASLQKLPENMQALQKGLENLQVSTKEDLQMLRADLEERVPKAGNTLEMPESKENLVEVENQAGRTVETNTSWGQESMREEMEKILSEKLALLQRQLEMTQQAIPPMKEMTNTWASLQKLPENMQALQKGLENLQVSTKEDLQMLRADLEERVPKAWNTPEMPESKENLVEVENQAGRTVEMITSVAMESVREEMEKILSEKLALLQRQLEMTQQAIPPMKEMTNTWASLQKLPENMQALQKGLENLQVSTKEDLQMLRADLEERVPKAGNTLEMPESKENLVEVENQAGRTVETNTSWGQESMREEMEKILSEKLAVLQRQLEMTQQAIPPMKEMTYTWASLQKLPENMQAPQKGLEILQESTKEDLQTLRADLEERVPKTWNVPKRSKSKENLVENQAGFFKMQRYKVDVTLNADTAHPRLEVSEDGKSVTDTGVIRQVPSKEERFDSHTFVLAKEGYTSGRQYFEVDVGKRRNWILGVASESVARKGTMTLSPENGFWVIGLADGEEYWAHTDPWTRLTVSGKPEKIGIFLNISANKLSFYNVKKKTVLYTFTSIGGSRLERKFVPFFSTGSSGSVHDTEPLKIVQEFDDDD
ncbi:nucleoprotein TPR isoform X43 [Gallus gallus]|uniref:nucleoprotein TPR isoform X43 n=1 Tax=Gallus gallus TaxID=9031 RepID=UPI001AE2E1CA|nr:nucleoprotein TPR isoform X43 [Gallus gallus]